MRPTPALLVVALALSAAPLSAQRSTDTDDSRWLSECRSGWNGDSDRGRACEARNVPVKLSGHALDVDGRENGGIHVVGWDGDSVRVIARIQASARDEAAARDLITDVKIVVDGRDFLPTAHAPVGATRTCR